MLGVPLSLTLPGVLHGKLEAEGCAMSSDADAVIRPVDQGPADAMIVDPVDVSAIGPRWNSSHLFDVDLHGVMLARQDKD